MLIFAIRYACCRCHGDFDMLAMLMFLRYYAGGAMLRDDATRLPARYDTLALMLLPRYSDDAALMLRDAAMLAAATPLRHARDDAMPLRAAYDAMPSPQHFTIRCYAAMIRLRMFLPPWLLTRYAFYYAI